MDVIFAGQYDKTTLQKAVSLANKPSTRSTVFRVGSTLLLTAIFVAYFIVIAGKDAATELNLMNVGRYLLTLPFLAYFLLKPYITSYLTASALWKSSAMREPISGSVSGQAISIDAPGKPAVELPWNLFVKKHNAPDLIVLVTAAGVLTMLPQRFFKSDSEWQRVRQWVDLNVVEAK